MIENLVIAYILKNEEYMRKVIPFISKSYFSEDQRKVFDEIVTYVNKFNRLPSKKSLEIEFYDKGYDTHILSEIYGTKETGDLEWMVDKTEQWCQQRAIEIAIAESYNIIAGKHKDLEKGAIPGILQDALSVSFDASIGHDYFEDAEERFDKLHEKAYKLPFDIEVFNEITKGGFEKGTLNIIMASCVSPNTQVRVHIGDEEEIFITPIAQVKTFLENGYDVFVDSPNGFTQVLDYHVKENFEEYIVETDNGCVLSCNKDHQIMTTYGWMTAGQIEALGGLHIQTVGGYSRGSVYKSGEIIPIVDIELASKQHAYYTEGIVSHNTGVGKSLVMCHMMAAYLAMGHDVLYITLEMADHKIANRVDANLMGIPLDDFEKYEKEELLKKLKGIQSKTAGKLITKQYPAGTANCNHFRALLDELWLKKKFKPLVIVFDYLNLASSTRVSYGVGTYQYVKFVAEEFRGLAVERDLIAISATQTNRCLELNTYVEKNNGEKIKIKNIEIGDYIKNNEGYVKVLKKYPIEKNSVYKITLENSKEIICSRKHEFPIGNNLKSILNGLSVGDELMIL